MTRYIDKSALVAEIESKKKYAQTLGDNAINSSMQQFYDGMKQGCVDLLSFLDILEVKEAGEEPVSKDLGEYISELSKQFPEVSFAKLSRIAVRVAKWKEEQMIANTADATIGVPYENKDGGYTHLIDVSRPLPVGSNKIAIIFKED